MTGLLLVLADAGGPRAAAALDLAAATAALGRPVTLFLTGPAVSALGSPLLQAAMATLAALGARLAICQTAMADHGLAATALPPAVAPTGLVHLLASHPAHQLILA